MLCEIQQEVRFKEDYSISIDMMSSTILSNEAWQVSQTIMTMQTTSLHWQNNLRMDGAAWNNNDDEAINKTTPGGLQKGAGGWKFHWAVHL